MLLKYMSIIFFSIVFMGCKRDDSIKITINNDTKYTIQYDVPRTIHISNEYENVQSLFFNSKIDTIKAIELYDQINGTLTLINQKPVIRITSLGPGESMKYIIRKHDNFENCSQVYFFYLITTKELNKEITFEDYVNEMKKSGFVVSDRLNNEQNLMINISSNNALKLTELAESDFSEFLRIERNH